MVARILCLERALVSLGINDSLRQEMILIDGDAARTKRFYTSIVSATEALYRLAVQCSTNCPSRALGAKTILYHYIVAGMLGGGGGEPPMASIAK